MQTAIYNKEERALFDIADKHVTPHSFLRELISRGIIDNKMCRIYAIKSRFAELVGNGVRRMDAITMTADEYCVSEDTVQTAIYRYKDV